VGYDRLKMGSFDRPCKTMMIPSSRSPATTISYNALIKSPKYRFDRIASEAFWTRGKAGAE